jgi:chaperonin cofactor prefoldin
MSLEELKKTLAPIHQKLNDNLSKQQELLEEYTDLLRQSVEITDAYFQQMQSKFIALENTSHEEAKPE